MHNLARYLIFFQYAGTKYSGVVKVGPRQGHVRGVEDCIQEAIRRLRPVNPVSLFISSRTDKGVHALCNSAHFDLQRKDDKPPFTEDVLAQALNHHLRAERIGIIRAHRVPDDFHARYRARSRTYVYRIAVGTSRHQLPVTEWDMCWSLHNMELDMDAMRQAAAILTGTHDFSSFRAISSDLPLKNPVRTLDMVGIQPGSSFAQEHIHRGVPLWELTFKGRSFLYKQVRRMTGALVAVGQGRLSLPRFKEVMDARDTRAYPQGLAAPAHGLFLTRVDYRETDLQPPQQDRGTP